MNLTGNEWKREVGSINELASIRANDNPPHVAFTALCMPAHLLQEIHTEWREEQFSSAAFKERGSRRGIFTVDGFYHDPAKSVTARAELKQHLILAQPATPLREERADFLANTFTQLASAWDRRQLSFELRGDYRRSGNVAHVDFEHEFVSLANIVNRSTWFLSPEASRTAVPQRHLIEGTSQYVTEYPMTKTLRAALEGVPEGSLTTWRGGDDGAIHMTPDFEGFRATVLASTAWANTAPALR